MCKFLFLRGIRILSALSLAVAGACLTANAQDYFVAYSHEMEEPDSLEIATKSVTASPQGGDAFMGAAMEFEYGVKGWWTTELYLDGQTTAGQSTVFTGFRLENRFRPLLREHWINPVLYVEFANINGADKTLLEVVGHDGGQDLAPRNDRAEKKREAELRLILSSNWKGWNIAENFIAEKNLKAFPWEFGYALGVSRPMALLASARKCLLCRENFFAGAEMYGGLGNTRSFGLRDTSHYLAPILSWHAPGGAVLMFSPGFGLNHNSQPVLLRLGITYELSQLFSRMRHR